MTPSLSPSVVCSCSKASNRVSMTLSGSEPRLRKVVLRGTHARSQSAPATTSPGQDRGATGEILTWGFHRFTSSRIKYKRSSTGRVCPPLLGPLMVEALPPPSLLPSSPPSEHSWPRPALAKGSGPTTRTRIRSQLNPHIPLLGLLPTSPTRHLRRELRLVSRDGSTGWTELQLC